MTNNPALKRADSITSRIGQNTSIGYLLSAWKTAGLSKTGVVVGVEGAKQILEDEGPVALVT